MGSDGLFYTQEQVKEIVAYAGERGIRVYPEFDIPGHTTSWFVSHPELASMPGPYAIEREWGIMDPALDPSKEEVYRFLDGFLGEMAALFPDPYLHIGGDEVNGKHWDASERLVAFKKEKGFKDNHELLGYFSQRLSRRSSTGHGKRMIGWDEILLPSLPKDSVVHSWRGQESLGAAAKQGYQGILSNGYYIDLMWSADRHYAIDPWGKGVDELPEAERARILGGEATMWSEFTTPEIVDSRIWPRTAAIAERLWSPREVDGRGRHVRAARRDEPVAGVAGPRPPRGLPADARAARRGAGSTSCGSSPTSWSRSRTTSGARRATTRSSAAVQPPDGRGPAGERRGARASRGRSTRSWPTRRGRSAARRSGRGCRSGRGIEARLRPLLEGSAILREAVPLAAEASALAAAGLEAVGFLEERVAAPESWWSSRAPLLEREKKPPTGLEVAYRPSIKRLMEAAAGK